MRAISDQAAPKGTGKVLAGLVWILTLVISRGQSAMLAKNSVLAEPVSQMAPLYFSDAGKVHVCILENLVESSFEHTLKRLSNKGRANAFPDTLCAFLCDDSFQSADATFLLGRVHLTGRYERE